LRMFFVQLRLAPQNPKTPTWLTVSNQVVCLFLKA